MGMIAAADPASEVNTFTLTVSCVVSQNEPFCIRFIHYHRIPSTCTRYVRSMSKFGSVTDISGTVIRSATATSLLHQASSCYVFLGSSIIGQ